jgi:predicted transcriptional regulator YheO
MKPDAVARILEIVASVSPLQEPTRKRVEDAIRRELGGAELRIPRRAPVTIEQVNAGLFARRPVREIASELGVSRATIYRMLAPRKSQASRG